MIPDFENMNYELVNLPAHYKATAWEKLRECERRLVMYRWVQALNDPAKAQRRVTLNDSVSAFLLTFEATIQFLKDQFDRTDSVPKFKTWLENQPHYDILIRGFRTLRHFEAHVEPRRAGRKIVAVIGGSLPDATSATSVSTSWHLPELQPSDLEKLRTPALSSGELPDWNNLVSSNNVDSLFEKAIKQLTSILNDAERIFSSSHEHGG
jgi:hypothetical protein